MHWIADHWPGITSLALMGGGVWWMMPREARWPKAVGLIIALIGAYLLAARLRAVDGEWGDTVMFSVFATGAIVSAILMSRIATRFTPRYGSRW